jgi:hypothetical protein
MIQITLKSKHFYFIAYHLRNASIIQYISLINRIKSSLNGNNNLEQQFSIDATSYEVIAIYNILTQLPEGQSNSFNDEMSALLEPQIISGIANEQSNGIVPNPDGSFPENAYWQIIGNGIQTTRANNITMRNEAISNGKHLIDTI